MNLIIKTIKPREVLKNKKISATKTKEARGGNKQRNKNSKKSAKKQRSKRKEQK